jgi:hypothetical protein
MPEGSGGVVVQQAQMAVLDGGLGQFLLREQVHAHVV